MKAVQLLAALLWMSVGALALGAEESPIGRQIGDFTLQDYLGAKHTLSEWEDKPALVVVFLGTECPLARLYGPRLVELAEHYSPQGVQFIGVNSNQQDTLLEIAHYARVHKIEFPLLKDAGNRIADQFGAVRTPEAFVLDEGRVVRYWGRIDDQYGVGYSRANWTTSELATALDELLAGKPVSTPITEAVGCHIGRIHRKPPQGDITYSRQISRLLQKHCVRCHRPGQIAPFSLTNYDEVIGWAETICEVMDDGRMPPWHANPAYGQFANDARMTADEKQLFQTWVDNGLPQGDPRQLPAAVKYDEGWQIGKPDAVFSMPEPFHVPAKGLVPYQYFYLDPKFEEDVWVRASEVRPGNRSVVHHIFLFFLPPGQHEPRAEDPLYNAVAAYAPGVPAGVGQEGFSRRIPAGSKLAFQVHYTPNGSEQVDVSEVGLVFAEPDDVDKEIKVQAALNLDFRIPPGAPDYRIEAGYQFTQDTFVHSLNPHMHYRGRSFRFTAKYPDGTQEVLVDVPRYDFNWQNTYVLQEPKLMPKGTLMLCTGRFDNSAGNLVNPDPTAEVRWGDQTWDEMMLGSFLISLPESTRRGEFPKVTLLENDQYQVTFRYRPDREGVKTVFVAGTFNDWDRSKNKMSGPDQDGFFVTTIRLSKGQHEYKFVLDGESWIQDPENPDRTGPFDNCVVRVPRRR